MSVLGIALGITVLITVLSVMNGFDLAIRKNVFTIIPEVTASGIGGGLQDWQGLSEKLRNTKASKASPPM